MHGYHLEYKVCVQGKENYLKSALRRIVSMSVLSWYRDSTSGSPPYNFVRNDIGLISLDYVVCKTDPSSFGDRSTLAGESSTAEHSTKAIGNGFNPLNKSYFNIVQI